MKQLFVNYSFNQIAFFAVIMAVAIKQLITFIDWAQNRLKGFIKEKEKPLEIESIAKNHSQQLESIKQELNLLKDNIRLLIQSDRDTIKQTLTKQHHFFCYTLKSIDDYSLDCMEKMFAHYQRYGGNSFVQALMEDVRALPKRINNN